MVRTKRTVKLTVERAMLVALLLPSFLKKQLLWDPSGQRESREKQEVAGDERRGRSRAFIEEPAQMTPGEHDESERGKLEE